MHRVEGRWKESGLRGAQERQVGTGVWEAKRVVKDANRGNGGGLDGVGLGGEVIWVEVGSISTLVCLDARWCSTVAWFDTQVTRPRTASEVSVLKYGYSWCSLDTSAAELCRRRC